MAKIERNPKILQFPRKFSIDIFADKNEIAQNELVTFGAYYPNLVEFYWDFGDGYTSNQRTPTHAFSGPVGTSFTVSLVAVANDGFPYYTEEIAFVTITRENYLYDVIQKPVMLAGLDKMVRNAGRCVRIREDNNDNETDIGFDGDLVDINAAKQFRDNNNANNIYWVGLYNQIDDTIIAEEQDKSRQKELYTDIPALDPGRFDGIGYPFTTPIDFNPIDDDIYAGVIMYGNSTNDRETGFFYQNKVNDIEIIPIHQKGYRTRILYIDNRPPASNSINRYNSVFYQGFYNVGFRNLHHIAEFIRPIKHEKSFISYNNYTSPGESMLDNLTFTHLVDATYYRTVVLRNAVIARDVYTSEIMNSFYRTKLNDITLPKGSIDKPYL